MQAYQSEKFRKMSPEAKRAALKSAIAANDPDSGFERDFEYQGKIYRSVPITNLAVEGSTEKASAEA